MDEKNERTTAELPRTPASVRRSPVTNRCVVWIGAALILVAMISVFAPALKGEFIWDDLLLIKRNPLVTGKFNLGTIWFHTDFPLSMVTLWLQWLLWGKHPFGYHAVNILLHAAGALLLWRVLWQLRFPRACAWFAALLFAVHPICAGTVAWISETKNTLSFCFFLASLSFYLRTLSRTKRGGDGLVPASPNVPRTERAAEPSAPVYMVLSYWLSLLFFALALLSKTSTVMLPVVLLLSIWLVRRRISRQEFASTLPFFALSVAFGLMTIWFQAHQAMAGKPLPPVGAVQRFISASKALLFYFDKASWPVRLNMIYPGWNSSSVHPLLLRAGLALAVLLALAFWCRRRISQRAAPTTIGADQFCSATNPIIPEDCTLNTEHLPRFIFFGLAYFVINLLPVLGFIDMYYFALSPVSDHLQYLALPGLCAAFGTGIGFLYYKGRRERWVAVLPVGILVAVLMAFGVEAHQRSRVLSRDESVWRDTLAKNPKAWLAHNNLGCILAERQDMAGAEREFTAALNLNPTDAQANCNYGKLLALKGDLPGAEQHYRAALDENSHDVEILKSFASTLLQERRAGEALPYFRKAADLEPSPENRLNLANALQLTGATAEAIAEYKRVLERRPDSMLALNNLAWILSTSRDAAVRNGSAAVNYAERACKLSGFQNPMALGTLAAAYAEVGRFNDAVTTMNSAIAAAQKGGQPQLAAMGRQLLQLFTQRRAYHGS